MKLQKEANALYFMGFSIDDWRDLHNAYVDTHFENLRKIHIFMNNETCVNKSAIKLLFTLAEFLNDKYCKHYTKITIHTFENEASENFINSCISESGHKRYIAMRGFRLFNFDRKLSYLKYINCYQNFYVLSCSDYIFVTWHEPYRDALGCCPVKEIAFAINPKRRRSLNNRYV